MTRLALAQTIVTGTVTLQGVSYSFTASGSGTATADRVSEAKKDATIASNTAAYIAARDAVYYILVANSAVLTDLEINSLISNNLSTTVVVFKPITLQSVASSTDGINYTLIKNTTLKSNKFLTVPNGITLTMGEYTFTNNGFFQVGYQTSSISSKLKAVTPTQAVAVYSADFINMGTCVVNAGATCDINAGVTFRNVGNNSILINGGTCNNNGTITNRGTNSSVINKSDGTITNRGSILNGGANSAVTNYMGATFINLGSITNTGVGSSTTNNNGGTWAGEGTCAPAGTCKI
jgi:hypothetical protein